MHDPATSGSGTAVQRLTVVVDSELLAALHAHQHRLESDTRLRVSLSQIAGCLMRRGLDHSSSEQHAAS